MDINNLDSIVSLAKRRGFVLPGSEIYGGLANSWDYGPLGVELKLNIKSLWWRTFVHGRNDIVGLDAPIIMNPKVWKASGHIDGFTDPLVECKSCHARFREDQIDSTKACENCGKNNWSTAKKFNLLFRTFIGPTEDSASVAYLRGETAQGMFIDFPQITTTTAKHLPYGIAQMGKAFRNEITPGNFIYRTREFEQMEIEYFIPEPKSDSDWQQYFEMWRKEFYRWFKLVGIDENKVHELEVSENERAHYSRRTIDFEFDYPFGRKELYGLAYRTNYDLLQHQKHSGRDMEYKDQLTGEKYIPHCIEPTWGVDRTLLAVLLSSYTVDGDRVFLKLPYVLAPYKVAVFPLVRNKEAITTKALSLFNNLKQNIYPVSWDDRGNVGKRYYAQDEIGTPFCITVDYQTIEDDTVTLRNRNTKMQDRVSISMIESYLLANKDK